MAIRARMIMNMIKLLSSRRRPRLKLTDTSARARDILRPKITARDAEIFNKVQSTSLSFLLRFLPKNALILGIFDKFTSLYPAFYKIYLVINGAIYTRWNRDLAITSL